VIQIKEAPGHGPNPGFRAPQELRESAQAREGSERGHVAEVHELREELRRTKAASQRREEYDRRRIRLAVVTAVQVLLAVVSFVFGFGLFALIFGVTAAVVWAKGLAWVESGTGGLPRFLLTCASDLVTVGVWLWGIFHRS
jgi:hypothetical protein